MDYSKIAIAVSIISLIISFYVAWHNSLKPAHIVGIFSHLTFWKFFNDKNEERDRCIVPRLWLRNIGAKPIIISSIKIVFKNKDTEFEITPGCLIPAEAVDQPDRFNQYNQFGFGQRFIGFCLAPLEDWRSYYRFNITSEQYKAIRGLVEIEIKIQIKKVSYFKCFEGSKCKVINSTKIDFGTTPYHSQLNIPKSANCIMHAGVTSFL